jgi:hypothetical protein
MIAILMENILEFSNHIVDMNKICFSDYILYKIYLKIKENSPDEVTLIDASDIVTKKNFDLIVVSSTVNLSYYKYFLYILYEEDNYLCDFNHENTDFKSLLSVATDSKPICKPKKFEITSPLFVEDMFDIINEKCFCFMHFDDTSMEYTELIDQYKTFPVVYRYDGNKYQIPENKGQRFFDFNFVVRNDIFSKTKYYVDFRNDNKFNINIIEALKNKCVVYLPNTEKNKKIYSHQNVKFFGKKIDPNQTFCDNIILDYSFPNCDQIVSDILSKHLFVKKSKFYI